MFVKKCLIYCSFKLKIQRLEFFCKIEDARRLMIETAAIACQPAKPCIPSSMKIVWYQCSDPS